MEKRPHTWPFSKQRESALPRQKLEDTVLIVLLAVLLAVVLLPMAWMILTGLKTRGTAFRLQFLPQLTVSMPHELDAAFAVPLVGPGEKWAHLEFNDPAATNVEVEVEGEERRRPLQRLFGGVWVGSVGPLGTSGLTYRYVVGGDRIVTDPAEPVVDGWNVRVVEVAGLSAPPDSMFVASRSVEGSVMLRVAAPQDVTVRARLESGRSIALSEESPGRFTGMFTGVTGDDVRVRLAIRRSLAEAMSELYTLNNFRTILTSETFNFGRFFMNSLIVATSAGLLTVFICTLAGYSFAVHKFHYREALFGVLLASMLVPGMIYMVPQFSITLKLGWLNTYQGMVVPHLANVFGLFLLRQYVTQIPKDLFAAARIDGAREWQVFLAIVIPICMPIMVTLFVLVFVGQWSNFLWQLIVNTGDVATMTLPVGLQQFRGQNATEWELIMAGACFSLLPITVIFFSLQRFLLQGLTAGAVKE
jgi:multiple sugar transport system permease protein